MRSVKLKHLSRSFERFVPVPVKGFAPYFYGASKKSLHKPRTTSGIDYFTLVTVLIIIYNFYVYSFYLKLT